MWRLRTHGQRTECEDRARILKQNSQFICTYWNSFVSSIQMGSLDSEVRFWQKERGPIFRSGQGFPLCLLFFWLYLSPFCKLPKFTICAPLISTWVQNLYFHWSLHLAKKLVFGGIVKLHIFNDPVTLCKYKCERNVKISNEITHSEMWSLIIYHWIDVQV